MRPAATSGTTRREGLHRLRGNAQPAAWQVPSADWRCLFLPGDTEISDGTDKAAMEAVYKLHKKDPRSTSSDSYQLDGEAAHGAEVGGSQPERVRAAAGA
jgi:hypothetical protein